MREKFALYMRKVIFAEFSNIMAVRSLSFRKQQDNCLNWTINTWNCFLTSEEKFSFVYFLLPAKLVKKVSRVVLYMKRVQTSRLRRRFPVAFFFVLFIWNVELPQTFAFIIFCHK